MLFSFLFTGRPTIACKKLVLNSQLIKLNREVVVIQSFRKTFLFWGRSLGPGLATEVLGLVDSTDSHCASLANKRCLTDLTDCYLSAESLLLDMFLPLNLSQYTTLLNKAQQ